MNRFPWGKLIAYGIRELRLPPHMFWQSTLRELVGVHETPMVRGDFAKMMQTFPDETFPAPHTQAGSEDQHD